MSESQSNKTSVSTIHSEPTKEQDLMVTADGRKLSHKKSRLFKPEKLNAPRDFQKPHFIAENTAENKRPLVVEIGAGKGMHACLYAKQNPEHDLIAIERTQNKFTAFKGLVHSVDKEVIELDNLMAVHADAIPYCVFALLPQCVDTLFLLYPNPEPKNPNQQWLNMPFFEFLLSRLKPSGKVVLASNIESYIDNAYEQSLHTWQLSTQRIEVPKDSRRTHFEIKYLARGEVCWELEMRKPEGYVTRFDEWVAPEQSEKQSSDDVLSNNDKDNGKDQ